ncbi:MAG: alpha/beta hydrolase [Pseudomonadota bacterium]
MLKISGLVTAILTATAAEQTPVALSEGVTVMREEAIFERRNGDTYAAEEITMMVPARWGVDDDAQMQVSMIRLPAVNPRGLPPVIYLAGGPGGSGTGTARVRRWPLFDGMRQVTDVILLDQRGTGISGRPRRCVSSVGFGPSDVIDEDLLSTRTNEAFRECLTFWDAEGIDLRAYTTAESAGDIAAVADLFGGKVSLVGISYGSHLALATLKAHADKIDRAVLVGVEGLNQTVKLPARVDDYLERLQAAVDQDPAAKERYPDIVALLNRVITNMDDQPATVVIAEVDGEPKTRVFTGDMARVAISSSVSDPWAVRRLLDAFWRADEEGDYQGFARLGGRVPDQISLDAMSTGMDLASGITPRRLRRVEAQAEKATVGITHNFPMPSLLEAGAAYQLSDSFRFKPRGDTPILVFSGTLDGRTFPEAGREATSGLRKNRGIVTVENAGHNLFLDHPDIIPSIVRFLEGEEIPSQDLTADLPSFLPREE